MARQWPGGYLYGGCVGLEDDCIEEIARGRCFYTPSGPVSQRRWRSEAQLPSYALAIPVGKRVIVARGRLSVADRKLYMRKLLDRRPDHQFIKQTGQMAEELIQKDAWVSVHLVRLDPPYAPD